MAEFAIAAGVLQVAGFGAELGGALWKGAKDIRNASKDLENISREVSSTAAALHSVGTLLESADTKTLHTPQLLDDMRKVLDGCREVFDELYKASKQFCDDNSAKRLLPRLRWSLGKSRLLELQGILERYKTVLSLMLQLLQIVEGRRQATSTELHLLEARLQDLVVSNKDLSQSNKTLSDAMASLLQHENKQRPATPDVLMNGPMISPGSSNDPTVKLSAVPNEAINTQQNGAIHDTLQSTTASDHLQRCLRAVLDLAGSIASALNKLEGVGPEAPLDIAQSFNAVARHVSSLRDTVKCSACSATATLSTGTISHVCAKPESDSKSQEQHAATWHFLETSGQALSTRGVTPYPSSSMESQPYIPYARASIPDIITSNYTFSQSPNWQQQAGPNPLVRPRSSPSTFGPLPERLSWTPSAGLGIQYTSASAQPTPPVTSTFPPNVFQSYPGEEFYGNSSPPELRQPQHRRPYQSIAPDPVGLAKRRRDEEESAQGGRHGKKRKRESSVNSADLSEEDRFLVQLKETESLSWKDIAIRFQSDKGKSFQVAALQMRYKRLREKFRVWEEADIRALELAHEYWEKCNFDINSTKMFEFGVAKKWNPKLCHCKRQEIQSIAPSQAQLQAQHCPLASTPDKMQQIPTSPARSVLGATKMPIARGHIAQEDLGLVADLSTDEDLELKKARGSPKRPNDNLSGENQGSASIGRLSRKSKPKKRGKHSRRQEENSDESDDDKAYPIKRSKMSEDSSHGASEVHARAGKSSTSHAMQDLLHRWFTVDARAVLADPSWRTTV